MPCDPRLDLVLKLGLEQEEVLGHAGLLWATRAGPPRKQQRTEATAPTGTG